jgi:tetratricopeptide (TPR) repeat protein
VGADEVILIPDAQIKAAGGRIRGQVVSESPVEIKFKLATGPEQAIPVDQIDSIEYEGLTPSFTLAQSRENTGNWSEAATLFKKAVTEASGKALIAREAQYREARALATLAQVDPAKAGDATAALQSFVKANPASRQLGSALVQLARLQLDGPNPERAEATLTELTSKVPAAAARAAVLRGRVLSRQGKYTEAVTAFDQLIATAPGASAQSREAKLAKAEALAGAKKFDESRDVVLEVIKNAPPEDSEIQAVAHNTLGDCLRAAGRPKDALLAYLKTDVLFDRDKSEHPRALARIEEIFRLLKRDKDADEVRERHRQLYPQSPYLAANK